MRTNRFKPLPALPKERAPWHADWNNSIAVCAAMRDENATDVREWLLYYRCGWRSFQGKLFEAHQRQLRQQLFARAVPRRWLGVDHVFLTDNNLENHDMPREEVEDLVSSGFLTLSREQRPFSQMPVYRRCLEHHRGAFNWMAFFDLDEFLLVREPCATAIQLAVHMRIDWRALQRATPLATAS